MAFDTDGLLGKDADEVRAIIHSNYPDIFRAHWDKYRRKHPVTPEQARVAGAIMACRTAQLGDG